MAENIEMSVVTDKDQMEVKIEDKGGVSIEDNVNNMIPVSEKRLKQAR